MRHEENGARCPITCNGEYDSPWSKTARDPPPLCPLCASRLRITMFCHLYEWIERVPGGTQQNDGLETGTVRGCGHEMSVRAGMDWEPLWRSVDYATKQQD